MHLPPELLYEEIDGPLLETYMTRYAKWLSKTAIPATQFDEDL